jgi:hypothetical protein
MGGPAAACYRLRMRLNLRTVVCLAIPCVSSPLAIGCGDDGAG